MNDPFRSFYWNNSNAELCKSGCSSMCLVHPLYNDSIYSAQIAMDSQCAQMHWLVLDWNSRAISFYERLGGNLVKESLNVKLVRPALSQLAAGEILPI